MNTAESHPRADGLAPVTIANRISSAIRELEDNYGKREADWFFAGYEFCTQGPRIWLLTGVSHVVMQLSFGSQYSWPCATYELAQECVHLLAPRNFSTNLEEGFSIVFARKFCVRMGVNFLDTTETRYLLAAESVGRLLNADSHAIRKLREHNLSLSELSADDILAVFPSLPSHDADFLSARFPART